MSTFVYYHSSEDVDYLPALKPLLKGHKVLLRSQTPVALMEVLIDVKKYQATGVICSNAGLLKLLLRTNGTTGTQDDFAGSIIKYKEYEFLILNPLKHVYTVSYGKFLLERYLSKFTEPDKWFKQTQFKWELANESSILDWFDFLSSCNYIAIDIETLADNRRISCVSYTGIDLTSDRFTTRTVVLPCESPYWLQWIRKLNATSPPKIFQNGKYDNAYFFRFNAPVKGWYFDTINLFHSWYSELPKRLDFVASFSLRNVEFWKNEGTTGNLEDYFRYNARDGWATANGFLSLIAELPEYAISNYLQEFPLVFPCHQAEMTGLGVDLVQLEKLKTEQEEVVGRLRQELGVLIGSPNFNPSSPPQVKRLLTVLGVVGAAGTGEIELKKAMFQHPLNTLLLDKVLRFRKARKLVSTYLVPEKFWKGRCFYALNPHGTDTARLASQESQFAGWGEQAGLLAGLQIHNIPRERIDIEIKSMFISDIGFYFGEGDYEQAEARDVAYLSGDKALLTSVESGKDFHAINAERFFGISYEKIYSDSLRKTLDKPLRDLSKRVNHGSNYNMGWKVLVDTMGLENLFKAKELLKLQKFWGPRQIAEYLLDCFTKAYPTVKGAYYEHIKYTIKTTHQLVSPIGWTRYCFGKPESNRQDLNAYVAHPSQNLNAGTLNKAWMSVYKNVALKEPKDFKLCAQIHDSILFQYRVGRSDLVERVKECMLFSVRVKDCKGIERDLRVPIDIKAGATRWSEIESGKM